MGKRLSICIAVYNIKEEYLRQCIESVTMNKSDDIEIILGDDCSTNGSGDICREYSKADSRIIYLRQEKNGGVSRLRNRMLEKATGEYIWFADGDDTVNIYYANVMTSAARKLDIIMFEWSIFEKKLPSSIVKNIQVRKLPSEAARKFSKACLTGAPSEIEAYGIKASTPSSVCNKIYKRDFLNRNGLRFKDGLKKSQDVEFNTRSFYVCDSVGYLEETMYFYRRNPTSVCNRYSEDISEIINSCIDCDTENLKKLFDNDTECISLWHKYKLIHYMLERFKLDIFHADNPKSRAERKKDFYGIVDDRLYKRFFESFDFNSYTWNERKLILKLAYKKKFAVLDFMFKYPISFKIYGHIKKIMRIISKGKEEYA